MKMKTINFYDTSSLLTAVEVLSEEKNLAISSITLKELERIKTSAHKDQDVKQAARRLTHLLDNNEIGATIRIHTPDNLELVVNTVNLDITDDVRILSDALEHARNIMGKDFKIPVPSEVMKFITNDLCLKCLAMLFFDSVDSIPEDIDDDYSGYKDITMSIEEMNAFYSSPYENIYNLEVNEYIIIRNPKDEIVDVRCWTGETYRHLDFNSFDSMMFGNVKPVKGDVYQRIACDSLTHNKITQLKGKPGSGKSYLSLGFLLHRLEKGKLDRIIIFCNPVATKDAARLGFYPGDKDSKLLDSQIGNFLTSKFGDRYIVEQMLQEGKLLLLPMSDIRGFDSTGMKAGIYITEAQNMSISLMKLALQRIGEDSICIIDGDCKAQVDDINFSGSNNGMKRASKVFRGEDIYGEVELKNIHRSRIGRIAEYM